MMTKYPLLIISLVLINTVQYINSIKRHITSLDWEEDHLLVSKKNYHNVLPDTPDCITSTSTSKNIVEHEINDNDIQNLDYSNPIETRRDNEDLDPELKPDLGDIKSCSKGQSFCRKINNYPREKIHKILNDRHHLKSISLFVEVSADSYNILFPPINTNEENLNYLCETFESVIYPEVALNENNEWRYIVQDKKNLTQGIRIVQCKENKMDCRILHTRSLPYGVSSCCVQEYSITKLFAIDSSKKINYEKFNLPFFCKCKHTMT